MQTPPVLTSGLQLGLPSKSIPMELPDPRKNIRLPLCRNARLQQSRCIRSSPRRQIHRQQCWWRRRKYRPRSSWILLHSRRSRHWSRFDRYYIHLTALASRTPTGNMPYQNRVESSLKCRSWWKFSKLAARVRYCTRSVAATSGLRSRPCDRKFGGRHQANTLK